MKRQRGQALAPSKVDNSDIISSVVSGDWESESESIRFDQRMSVGNESTDQLQVSFGGLIYRQKCDQEKLNKRTRNENKKQTDRNDATI